LVSTRVWDGSLIVTRGYGEPLRIKPFDDEGGSFLVSAHEEQHSLRPVFANVPAGRRAVYGEATRASWLGYIQKNWNDVRPLSLRARLGSGPGPGEVNGV
jgi:uncharacterized protein YbdZ (MbtH family)